MMTNAQAIQCLIARDSVFEAKSMYHFMQQVHAIEFQTWLDRQGYYKTGVVWDAIMDNYKKRAFEKILNFPYHYGTPKLGKSDIIIMDDLASTEQRVVDMLRNFQFVDVGGYLTTKKMVEDDIYDAANYLLKPVTRSGEMEERWRGILRSRDSSASKTIVDSQSWRTFRNTVKTKPRCETVWHARGAECERLANHTGGHRGRTASGLTLFWTDEDMIPKREQSTKALVGWRVWLMTPGPRLKSVTSTTVWEGPVMTTRDDLLPYSRLEMEAQPLLGSSPSNLYRVRQQKVQRDYGVYSYKTPQLCFDYMLNQTYGGGYPVVGKMDLTGVVVEHELGYRAQRALVTELWLIINNPLYHATGESKRQAAELARRYGCPCTPIEREKLSGWAKWYTDTHPEDFGQP